MRLNSTFCYSLWNHHVLHKLGTQQHNLHHPAEFFPERFCSICHGISAAAGKAGDIIGAFVVQSYTWDTDSLLRALLALAVISLVGFFFTFLVPETESQPFVLPRVDTLSDQDNRVMANAIRNQETPTLTGFQKL